MRKQNILLVVIVLVCVCICMVGCDSETGDTVLPSVDSAMPLEPVIKTPNAAEDWCGLPYDTVVSELRNAGFSRIEIKAEEDLTFVDARMDGKVTSISIDGDAGFLKGDEFSEDALVIVTYHTIIKAVVPISSDNIQDYDPTALEAAFLEAGFINIKIDEVYDLDPDEVESEYINELYVEGDSEFTRGAVLPYDTEISITFHRPYEKYTVDIHITFMINLIFSRYGIVVYLDDEEIENLAHGEDADFSFRVKEGVHTITFVSTDSSNLKEKLEIDVSSDIEAEYRLWCYRDRVELEQMYFDRKIELAENQAKVPTSASAYRYDYVYQDVVDELTEAGFINIKTVVLYDIFWGITIEGDVESVTIGGNSSFTRGQIFEADEEIVITYHMPEDDDPSKISMPEDSSAYIGMNYQDVEKVFKDLGFVNITTKSSTIEDTSYVDGEVCYVKVYGWNFDKGETFDPDDSITIYYYIIEEPVYITVPDSASAYIGMNYQEVEKIFKDLGFSNIDVEEKETADASRTNGEVFTVTVAGQEVKPGDSFKEKETVCIKYYTPESPVSYSTNGRSTVRNGNTGIYAYKKSGGLYDLYWIIDFDEGYAYQFAEGDGNEWCDRLKIESGDLNSVVIVTYRDGGVEWSYGLHFKWVNQPDHLIMQDHNGCDWDYYPTNLSAALSIRGRKSIKDY